MFRRFWAESERGKEGKVMRDSSRCWGACELGSQGSALRCAGHGGGEVAATKLVGGSVARGGGIQRVGKWVQRLRRCHVRRRAKQEVACGLTRRWAVALSAGGAEAERERGGRKSLDLFAKSKNFMGPTVNQK